MSASSLGARIGIDGAIGEDEGRWSAARGNPARPSGNSSTAARCRPPARPSSSRPRSRAVSDWRSPQPWRRRRLAAPSCRRNKAACDTRRVAMAGVIVSRRSQALRHSLAAAHRCADRRSRSRRARPSDRSRSVPSASGAPSRIGRARSSLLQARRGRDDARIVAFRQNDFAIALPCDIKQTIKQIHASHRVRKTRKLRARSRRGHQ